MLFFRVKLAIIGGISKPFTSLRDVKRVRIFFCLSKIYMKKRESEQFSTPLSLLDFYGWVGNSITISTALVNDMRGGIFTPALLR